MSYVKVVPVRGRPGYALMEIGYALSVDPVQFTLQRVGADQRFLGRDGRWRVDADPLEPQHVERHANRTVLSLGPSVVDCLEDDERVRVEISSTGFAAEIVWSDVPRSSGRVGSALFSRPEPPMSAPPFAPPPVSEPVAPEPESEAPPEVERPRPSAWPWVLLALLVLAAAGTAGWYYHEQLLALVVPPKTKPNPDTELARIKGEVTDLIRSQQCDAARIFDGGRRLMQSDKPEMRDFGFRAVDAAAGCGFPGAQLEMGRLYDPRYFQAGRVGLDKANASVASEWYLRSKNGGSSEAATELSGLCQQLRNPSGDDEEVRTRTLAQYCN